VVNILSEEELGVTPRYQAHEERKGQSRLCQPGHQRMCLWPSTRPPGLSATGQQQTLVCHMQDPSGRVAHLEVIDGNEGKAVCDGQAARRLQAHRKAHGEP
jgi:hypothetical protein